MPPPRRGADRACIYGRVEASMPWRDEETILGPTQRLTPEGFLLCKDVPIARTGEQLYHASELPMLSMRDGDDQRHARAGRGVRCGIDCELQWQADRQRSSRRARRSRQRRRPPARHRDQCAPPAMACCSPTFCSPPGAASSSCATASAASASATTRGTSRPDRTPHGSGDPCQPCGPGRRGQVRAGVLDRRQRERGSHAHAG